MEEKTKSNFWQNLWNTLKDWWEVANAIWWAIMTAIQYSTQWLSWGIIKPQLFTFALLLVFLISTCYAIIKAKLGQRKAEKNLMEFKQEFEKFKSEKNSSTIQTTSQSGGLNAGIIKDSPVHLETTYNYPLPNTKEKSLPNIEIGESHIREGILYIPYIHPRTGLPYRNNPFGATLMDVVFSNNPKIRNMESISRNVLAKIIYYDNDSEIGSISGGWENPTKMGIVKTVDFPFNGESRILFVAVRPLQESSLYMHGIEMDENYFGNRFGDFKYRLSAGEIKNIQVKIHLIGENLDQEYKLILHYAGIKGKSEIEVIK